MHDYDFCPKYHIEAWACNSCFYFEIGFVCCCCYPFNPMPITIKVGRVFTLQANPISVPRAISKLSGYEIICLAGMYVYISALQNQQTQPLFIYKLSLKWDWSSRQSTWYELASTQPILVYIICFINPNTRTVQSNIWSWLIYNLGGQLGKVMELNRSKYEYLQRTPPVFLWLSTCGMKNEKRAKHSRTITEVK